MNSSQWKFTIAAFSGALIAGLGLLLDIAGRAIRIYGGLGPSRYQEFSIAKRLGRDSVPHGGISTVLLVNDGYILNRSHPVFYSSSVEWEPDISIFVPQSPRIQKKHATIMRTATWLSCA